jgi:hypothetical protein
MNTVFLLIIVAILIGYGCVNLFLRDMAWGMQERSNRMRGIVDSEPTPTWDTQRMITGVISIGVGIVLLVMALNSQ